MNSRTLLILATIGVAAAAALFWQLSRSAGERGPGPADPRPRNAPRIALDARGLEAARAEDLRKFSTRGVEGLVPGTGPSTALAGDPSTVHGSVFDATGAPVPRASVRMTSVLGGDAATTRTQEGGEFELRIAASGPFEIEVRAPGFVPFADDVIGEFVNDEIRLEPIVLARGVTLSGRVVDAHGTGVAGAELFDETGGFWRATNMSLAVSDAGGEFRVDQLAAGPWRLGVFAPGYLSRVFDGTTRVPGEVVEGIVFRLGAGVSIRGAVAGLPASASGRWQVRALIAAESLGLPSRVAYRIRRAAIASSGAFEVRGLIPGDSYRLWIAEALPSELAPERSAVIEARAGDTGVHLIFRPSAALVFQVLDAETRRPVTGFRVRAGLTVTRELLDAEGDAVLEHPEGRVRFGGLLPDSRDGEARLEIVSVGYAPLIREQIPLAPGAEVDLGTLLLEPAAVVRFRVREAGNGNPVAGALVTMSECVDEALEARGWSFSLGSGRLALAPDPSAQRAYTDAAGVALFTSREGRRASFRVECEGWAPGLLECVLLPTGRDYEGGLDLDRGGIVRVHVVESDGTPVPGVRVSHRDPQAVGLGSGPLAWRLGAQHATDEKRTGSGEDAGAVRFLHLVSGVHAFRAGRGRDARWVDVDVRALVQQSITLVVPKLCSLSGTVREEGVQLSGARIQLTKPSRGYLPGAETTTDTEGRYRLDELEVGEYEFVLRHPGRSMPSVLGIELREGENDLPLDLPVAIIEGRAFTGDGLPLIGVQVSVEEFDPTGALGGYADTPHEVITDASGFYRLRGIEPDTEIVVRGYHADHQEAWSEPFELGSNELRRELDLVLDAGGSIRASITHRGAPANFGWLKAEWLGESDAALRPRIAVAREGLATLTGLRPGRWIVTWFSTSDGTRDDVHSAGEAGSGSRSTEVTVEAHAIAQITLSSEP